MDARVGKQRIVVETTCCEIEILLAAYQGEAYIREQIQSILDQTDTRWHLTLSDDGSTDDTVEILKEYVEKYPEQMTLYRAPKRFGNARDHFFHLMKACSAKYMLFCDQDDVWYPQKIERTMRAMHEAEQTYELQTPLLVFTDQTPTDERLHPLAPSLMRYQNQFFEYFDCRSILMQNVVTGGAMCINRTLADLAMKCISPAQTIMHDWWIAVVAARFGKVIYIDEPLSDYRQHGSNSIGAKDVRSMAYITASLMHLKSIRQSTKEKKRQARVFMDTYAAVLSKEDKDFLMSFVKHRSGPMFYWRYHDLIHDPFRLVGMLILG